MTRKRYLFRFAIVALTGMMISFLAATFVHPNVGAVVFLFTLAALLLLNTP